MKSLIAVLLFCSLSFGSTHLAYQASKAATYPVRHPAKSTKTVAHTSYKATKATAKGLYKAASFVF